MTDEMDTEHDDVHFQFEHNRENFFDPNATQTNALLNIRDN